MFLVIKLQRKHACGGGIIVSQNATYGGSHWGRGEGAEEVWNRPCVVGHAAVREGRLQNRGELQDRDVSLTSAKNLKNLFKKLKSDLPVDT